jgi:hypothetical protein
LARRWGGGGSLRVLDGAEHPGIRGDPDAERGFERLESRAGGVDVLGVRPVVGAPGAVARREEAEQRVRVTVVEQPALADVADERLPRQCGAAEQGAERRLDGGPALEQVGGDLVGVVARVEAGDDGACGVECGDGGSLIGLVHRPRSLGRRVSRAAGSRT